MKIKIKRFTLLIIISLIPFSSFSQSCDDQMEEVQLLADQGKYKKAVKVCDKIIEKYPNYVMAYLNKSVLLEAQGKFVESIQNLSKGLAANNHSTSLYNARGIIYMQFKLYEEAIRDFNQGMKFADNDSLKYGLMLNKSAVYIKMRKFDVGYDLLEQCYAFDSTDLNVLNNIAAVCDEVGKGEMTLVYLKKIIAIDSTFVSGYVNIGFHYQSKGEFEESILYFDKALALDPNESLALNNRGYSKLKMGDLEGALTDVNRSIELFPTNSYAYRNLALIYIEMNKPSKVCEAIEDALLFDFTKQYGTEVLELQHQFCK